jgi:hypothetical protein
MLIADGDHVDERHWGSEVKMNGYVLICNQ